jgi:hypothetical protein
MTEFITNARESFWTFASSGPVGAGVAGSITLMLGNAVASRSRFLGLALTGYLAWVAWEAVSRGGPFTAGTLTPENNRDLATISVCLGFIVGTCISLSRKLTWVPLTAEDLRGDALEIRDQRRATRVFNAARNTYDRFCAAHPVDPLDITEQETALARQEPSLELVECHLLNVASWCRRQGTSGLTASLLDQLGALYLRQGRLDDARKHLEEAGAIFDSLPNAQRLVIRVKSSFHFRLGVLEYRHGNVTAALEWFERSLLEAQASGSSDASFASQAIERCRRSTTSGQLTAS